MSDFTHFDREGNAVMVDVSDKNETERVAVASSKVMVSAETMKKIKEGKIGKGDVLGVARVAGIMASKQTSNLIPMCHPLLISKSTVDFNLDFEESSIEVISTVKITGKTGVEMEALTSCQIAALTIYDMCKAIDKRMIITNTHLVSKRGGKSGDFNFHE